MVDRHSDRKPVYVFSEAVTLFEKFHCSRALEWGAKSPALLVKCAGISNQPGCIQ
jgi:hypothetical protein